MLAEYPVPLHTERVLGLESSLVVSLLLVKYLESDISDRIACDNCLDHRWVHETTTVSLQYITSGVASAGSWKTG